MGQGAVRINKTAVIINSKKNCTYHLIMPLLEIIWHELMPAAF
jgi:hypothetical protein